MGKGKILQGDQLLEINGQSVRESNQKDVANQLNQLDGELVLLLGKGWLDFCLSSSFTKLVLFFKSQEECPV